jgi:hypothetical protein
MCWNEPISWITFMLGTGLNLMGLYLSDDSHKLLFILFQSIIMVQLGEALIWRDQNGPLGLIGTYIAFFGVWLQPIIGFMLMVLYKVNTPILYITGILLVCYIVASFEPIKDLSNNRYQTEACCGDQQEHVIFSGWTDTIGNLYMCLISLTMLTLFPKFPYVSGYIILTYFISTIIYKKAFASIWCWFSVFSPMICYLTQTYQTIDAPWLYSEE